MPRHRESLALSKGSPDAKSMASMALLKFINYPAIESRISPISPETYLTEYPFPYFLI
jgi:hypothetical protein